MTNNTSNWTKTSDGFCSEISQFKGEKYIILEDGTKMSLNWFKPHVDVENEITHWVVSHRGNIYTLFND